MEFPCIVCQSEVMDSQQALECESCFRWQHRRCGTGISASLYRRVTAGEPFAWSCRDCPAPVPSEIESVDTLYPAPIFESTRASIDIPRAQPPRFQQTAAEIREQLLEESLADPVAVPSRQDDFVTLYKVTDEGTQRGKRRLTDNIGFSYSVKRTVKTTTYWGCSVRNKNVRCPATVIEKDGVFREGTKAHVHPAIPGIGLSTEIVTESKKAAMANPYCSAPSVVDQVIIEKIDKDAPCPALPAPINIARAANRARRKERPNDPTDLSFELAEDYIPEDFLIGDIRVGRYRHLVFASSRQLTLLSTAKNWYLDATFKIVKAPFRQLFSVHAFVRSNAAVKQVPLAFALMSKKRSVDYEKVFECLRDKLPRVIALKHAVCDFEAGIWSGIRAVFSNVTLQGCAFHWAQAVFKKVRKLGLEPAYTSDEATYKLIRRILALPFMPANKILPLFQELRDTNSTTAELINLFSYINETWMEHSIWRVSDWCVFGRSVRTNNDVEGWHNRINSRAGRGDLQFYLLLKFLHQEAELVSIQVKLVSEGKLTRILKKKTRDFQSKIFQLWDEYQNSQISETQLLRRIARLYGPVRE